MVNGNDPCRFISEVEHEAATCELDSCRLGAADGDISEHRGGNIIACGFPLYDVRLARLDAAGVGKVQRQRAIGGEVRCRQKFLHRGTFQRCSCEGAEGDEDGKELLFHKSKKVKR